MTFNLWLLLNLKLRFSFYNVPVNFCREPGGLFTNPYYQIRRESFTKFEKELKIHEFELNTHLSNVHQKRWTSATKHKISQHKIICRLATHALSHSVRHVILISGVSQGGEFRAGASDNTDPCHAQVESAEREARVRRLGWEEDGATRGWRHRQREMSAPPSSDIIRGRPTPFRIKVESTCKLLQTRMNSFPSAGLRYSDLLSHTLF